MIRILQVVGGMNFGGTESFIMNLYRNIDKKLIQFDFLVNRKGIFDDEIKKLGGKIYIIPSLQKVGPIKYTKNLDNFLIDHINEYNIIHSHINQVSGLILERANRAGIPIRIAHSHNNKYGKNILTKLYKNYLKTKIKDNANYKFACSKLAGEFLFGADEEFVVINNAIDFKKFIYNEEIRKKIRKDFLIDNDCFVIGSVGRLTYQKNSLFLLHIFNEFTKIVDNSKMILVGKGELKGKLIKYIENNNLKNKVIMLEDRTDVNHLMQAMDYFVLPSKFEGLGIVLIEAQAAGLKCIASKDVIPNEAKVTQLLDFYSLNKSATEWAQQILHNKNYERKNMTKEIIDKNYDIFQTAKKLENFYISKNNEILKGK